MPSIEYFDIADLMIVSGRVSQKMAPVLTRIYEQMPDYIVILAWNFAESIMQQQKQRH